MRPVPVLAAAAALLAGAPAIARTVEDTQLWLNVTAMQTTPGGFAWFAEAQPRFGDGRLQQLLLRPAVGRRLSGAVTVYAGYAHVMLPRPDLPDRNEERLFAQVSWTVGALGGGALSSRTRLEHRDLSGSRDVGWRLREMVRYVRPLGSPRRTRVLGSIEGFVAFNDTEWGANAGFDQLRSFAGVEVPLRGKSTLELGYLNQFVNNRGGDARMNHVASAALFVRF